MPRRTIEVAHTRVPLPYDPHKRDCLALTLDQRRGQLAYLLKGLDPATAERVGVDPEDQG